MPEVIRTLMQAWDDAHAAADADALAALYTADAVVLAAPGKPVQGRAAIAAYFRARLPLKERDQPRPGPRKCYFFPPLVHLTATAAGRHGEKHAALDVLVQQQDGGYLIACSSWTWR